MAALPGTHIEARAMPRALEAPVHHVTAREREVAVRTAIFDREYFLMQPDETDATSIDQRDGERNITRHFLDPGHPFPGSRAGSTHVSGR